jgi:hypothetical protein
MESTPPELPRAFPEHADSSSVSSLCHIMMSGIMMPYDILVHHIPVIYLAYDKNLSFSNKTHVSILSRGYMASIKASYMIHNESLHMWWLFKRYTVLKIAVVLVYDKYIPILCLVYAKIFMFSSFNQLCFYWKNNNEIAAASLNQYVHMHSEARDITQSLVKHVLLSSHIWQVYDRYMHVIYLQLTSSCSAGHFRAFLVFQARRAASDLNFLRIRSVLATERPPTRHLESWHPDIPTYTCIYRHMTVWTGIWRYMTVT